MNTRHNLPFQLDRPVFVKVPFGKYEQGDHLPWKELSMTMDRVLTMYNQGMLHHNAELEKEARVGDGLDTMDHEQLTAVVDSINAKVKAKTPNKTTFDRIKCKKSKILDKQRGLIRSWRRNYGQYEVD